MVDSIVYEQGVTGVFHGHTSVIAVINYVVYHDRRALVPQNDAVVSAS